MGQPDAVVESQAGPVFIIVMGVSGTGKSTLGAQLAKVLDLPYVEGDDLHPKSNIEKMSSGHALNDADREPWLELIRATALQKVVEQQKQQETDVDAKEDHAAFARHGVVITCSALKRYYRDILRGRRKPASKEKAEGHVEPAPSEVLPTYFVFIEGSRELLLDRMTKRPGHFMKASMLDGQLDTLESPASEEGVVVVSAEQSPEEQVKEAVEGLGRLRCSCFQQ